MFVYKKKNIFYSVVAGVASFQNYTWWPMGKNFLNLYVHLKQ